MKSFELTKSWSLLQAWCRIGRLNAWGTVRYQLREFYNVQELSPLTAQEETGGLEPWHVKFHFKPHLKMNCRTHSMLGCSSNTSLSFAYIYGKTTCCANAVRMFSAFSSFQNEAVILYILLLLDRKEYNSKTTKVDHPFDNYWAIIKESNIRRKQASSDKSVTDTSLIPSSPTYTLSLRRSERSSPNKLRRRDRV